MIPPDKRLRPNHVAGLKIYFRLVIKDKLVLLQSFSQIGFEANPLERLQIHLLGEKTIVVFAKIFCVIHCRVCIFEKRYRICTIFRIDTHPYAGTGIDIVAPDIKHFRDFGDDAFGHARCRLGIFYPFHDDHKLVTAEAGNGIFFAHTTGQPFGHHLQKTITHMMAKHIVDIFKIIEIDEQNRQRGAVTVRHLDGMTKPVVQ